MSRYRRLQVSTWTDEKFLRLTPLRPSGQGLWLYLLTGRHTTAIPGLSGHGIFTLAEHLKWPLKDVRRHWAEIEAQGMGRADWSAPCLWLPNAIRYNRPESPNVVKSWPAQLSEIPACRLRDEAMSAIRLQVEAIGEGFGKAFRDVFGSSFGESGSGTGSGTGVPPNPPPSGGRITRGERKRAEDLRRAVGRCTHEPRCVDYEACILEIVGGLREREHQAVSA